MYGDTVLGNATNLRDFTPALGMGTFGAELSGTMGTSTVMDIDVEECGCAK